MKRRSGDVDAPNQAKKRKSSGNSPVKSPKKRDTTKYQQTKSLIGSPVKKQSTAKSPGKKYSSESPSTKTPVRNPATKASSAESPRIVKLSPAKKAVAKTVAGKAKKSPVALPVPSKASSSTYTPTANGSAKTGRKKRIFQMPAVTKSEDSKGNEISI